MFVGCTAPLALAFVTPEVDSAFDTGQNPPLCFFFGCDDESATGELGASVVCVTVAVEFVEALEFNDDEEELLWTVFRCGINIRDTSSVLMAENPPWLVFEPFHPSLGRDWKLGGEATAVVIELESSIGRWKIMSRSE